MRPDIGAIMINVVFLWTTSTTVTVELLQLGIFLMSVLVTVKVDGYVLTLFVHWRLYVSLLILLLFKTWFLENKCTQEVFWFASGSAFKNIVKISWIIINWFHYGMMKSK